MTLEVASARTKVRTFEAKINRDANSKREVRLGLDIDYAEENQALLILEVHPGGAVADWNKKNPGSEIRCGDAIVSVNGKSLDVDKMLKACCLSPTVELLIVQGTAMDMHIDPTASGLMAVRAYLNAEAKKEGDGVAAGTGSAKMSTLRKSTTLTWSIRG